MVLKFFIFNFDNKKMALTLSELTVLKNDIIAKSATVYNGSTFAIHQSNTKFDQVAAYYNSIASPQVDLWRPDVLIGDITNIIDMSAYITLTVAKQNGWMAMSQGSVIDATLSQVRANFVTIFGNGTATTNAAISISKKAATNFELLYTTNNVSTKYKYVVSVDEIIAALRS